MVSVAPAITSAPFGGDAPLEADGGQVEEFNGAVLALSRDNGEGLTDWFGGGCHVRIESNWMLRRLLPTPHTSTFDFCEQQSISLITRF